MPSQPPMQTPSAPRQTASFPRKNSGVCLSAGKGIKRCGKVDWRARMAPDGFAGGNDICSFSRVSGCQPRAKHDGSGNQSNLQILRCASMSCVCRLPISFSRVSATSTPARGAASESNSCPTPGSKSPLAVRRNRFEPSWPIERGPARNGSPLRSLWKGQNHGRGQVSEISDLRR